MSDQAEQGQPDTRPCVQGCGFFGSAQTGYMCSKCFKDTAAANRARVEAPLPQPAVVESPVKVDTVPASVEPAIPATAEPEIKTTETAQTEAPPQKKRTRCNVCNKKVGLTGIECRCNLVFCGLHRYPDQHSCTFDFKTHDRANLEKAVVGGGAFSKLDHV